jgi:glycosyltransferase involved in cell wall biosynthesis
VRIALLSVSADIGGSETSLLELVRGLAATRGFEPIVVLPRTGPLEARVRAAGAATRILPMPEALLGFGEWSMRSVGEIGRHGATLARALAATRTHARDLAALLRELDPAVVHTNGLKMHVLAARAAAPNVPIVWHLHEYLSPRRLSRILLRHHLPRASAIVANSRSVAADLAETLGADAPISTIYNAVDLDTFAPDGARADLDRLAGLPPAAQDVCRIGLLATFARWKGHDVFLRAVREASAPLRAYVIGGPVYDTSGSQHTIEELRARAAALGMADRVGFTGFVERPADALRALDVVVHASTESEPFGLVIAEGMACGKAVVISRAGGAAELVTDGVDAIATPPGDVSGLASALDRCAADLSLRARLGDEARRTAVRQFDPAAFVRAFAEIYTGLAAQRTQRFRLKAETTGSKSGAETTGSENVR